MNPHILMVIDNQLNPGKYTQEQLDKNADDAYAYASADVDPYDYDYAASYTAAYAAATYAAVDCAAAVDYWLRRYFKSSGENKQDYIDEINKLINL